MREAPGKKVRGQLAVSLAVAGVVLLVAGNAPAASYTWDGNAPGGTGNPKWSTATNWNPNSVPPVTNTATVIVMAGTVKQTNSADSNYTINQLQFSNGGFVIQPNASQYLTFSGTSAGISSTGNNQLTLQVRLGAANTWTSSSGTLALSGGVVANGNALSVTGAGNTTITSGGISGTGTSLSKSGSGTLTLASASNTYTGTTTVSGGTLLYNGTLTGGGNFSVAPTISGSGATLGGTGTIALAGGRTFSFTGLDAGTKAIVSPGDPATNGGVGTLTLGSGSQATVASFNSNSQLALNLNSTQSDLLRVFGTLNLNSGSALTISGTPTAGSYTLVQNTGTRSGTFSSVTAPGLGTTYRVRYQPNQIDLQKKGTLAFDSASVLTPRVIAGGMASVGVSVSNTVATPGAATIGYTVTPSVGSGSVSGSVAPGTSGSHTLALDTTGVTPGLKAVDLTANLSDANTDQNTNAWTNTAAPTHTGLELAVLDHSRGALDDQGAISLTLDFGHVAHNAVVADETAAIWNLASELYGSGLTAGLQFVDWQTIQDSGQFATDFDGWTGVLPAGQSQPFAVSFTTDTPGTFQTIYRFHVADDTLPGADLAGRDLQLTVTGTVLVPEPAALGLTGLGMLGLLLRRRRPQS